MIRLNEDVPGLGASGDVVTPDADTARRLMMDGRADRVEPVANETRVAFSDPTPTAEEAAEIEARKTEVRNEIIALGGTPVDGTLAELNAQYHGLTS